MQNWTGKLESEKDPCVHICVPDRGERARTSSVFIGLDVVTSISDDLKVAIAQQVQNFALCGMEFAD